MAETIKGLNIKLGLDTSDLDQKLKDINSELKEEQRDLRAINNSLRYDSTNLDKWREKQAKLNKILETTKKRLEVQNARLEESKKALAVGAISEEQFNKVRRSVEYTTADINKLNNELRKTEENIKRISSIDVERLRKVGSGFSKYVTAPIVAASTALGAIAVKATKTADAIADEASKVNMTVEAFQEWEYVSKMLASDSTQLHKALVKTNTILGDVATGGEKYGTVLSELGLELHELTNISTDEAFELIRSSLSKVEDQALRTTLANQFFGEQLASELNQVLGASSKEIENLREQARELGVVTTEQAEISGRFHDSLDNLKQSVMSLSVAIGVEIVPTMQKMVETIQAKVIPVIRNLTNWWSNLSGTFKRVIVIMLGVVAAIGPVISIVAKAIPLITKLKGAFAGGQILTFIKGISLGKVALIGLIAALAAILLKNEKFRELLKQIIELVKRLLEPIAKLITSLLDKLKPVIDLIIEVINKVIDVVVEIIEGLMPTIESIINILVDILSEVIELVMGLIEEILPVLIILIEAIMEIVEALMPIIEIIIDLVSTIIGQLLNLIRAILEPITRILKIIIQIVGNVIRIVGNLINTILEPLNSILNVLVSIIEVISKVLEVVINVIVTLLEPALKIIFAILEPLLEIVNVFIEVIAMIIEQLAPLLELLIGPLVAQLDFMADIFEALAPLITAVGEIFSSILAPVLEIIYELLEPILWVLEKIIGAFKWIIDNISKIAEGIGGVFQKVGGFFGDLFTGRLFQSNKNTTTNYTAHNNVTVNTTASTFDVNSINKALGGVY